MKELGLAGSHGKGLYFENGQKREKMAKTGKSKKLENQLLGTRNFKNRIPSS